MRLVVWDDRFDSDHFPVFVRIDDMSSIPFPCRPSFSTAHVDWDVFQRECRVAIEQLHLNSLTLNHTYSLLINHIQNALLTAGARKHDHTKNIRKPLTAWWDEECYELIYKRSSLFKKFKANHSISNYEEYISTVKIISKNFRKKKNNSKNFAPH